jgi:hypothetical protein
MEAELHLRIVLEKPPAGVDFGLQEGKGHAYKTVQIQRSNGGNLTFDCTVTVKDNRKDGLAASAGWPAVSWEGNDPGAQTERPGTVRPACRSTSQYPVSSRM